MRYVDFAITSVVSVVFHQHSFGNSIQIIRNHSFGRIAVKGVILLVAFVLTTDAIAQSHTEKVAPQWSVFVSTSFHQNESAGRSATPSADTIRYYVARATNFRQLSNSKRATVVRRLDEHHAIIRYQGEAAFRSIAEGLAEGQPANDLWKLSPALLSRQTASAKRRKADARFLERFIVQGSNYRALKPQLVRHGVVIVAEHPRTNAYTVEISYADCERLWSWPEIIFVSEATVVRQEESFLANPDIHVNRINQVHHAFPNLDGGDQVISIKEEAYDPEDIDLLGRHQPTPNASTTISAHATDMATLLAGGGTTAPTSRGVVPGALLTSSSFESLFPDTHYEAVGITVQNHSYGSQIESFYGAEAQAYDQSTQDIPSLLHVFSVGNSGTLSDSLGPYRAVPGFANLTGNYKLAKNVLTVGAVNQRGQIDSLISRGPAHDGRIKPELVAYSSDGSSGAAALVSGTAVLLQQAYQQTYNEPAPAALLKAILLNSAQDVGTPGPDYFSGYGNLDASRALQTLQNKQYYRVVLSDQQDTTVTFTLPQDARNLKVTLAWNDPAAPSNSSPALLNDLNLTVTRVSTGRQWLPWVLNSYPHIDSLQQPARRGVDRLNPVEQVTLARPPAGEYQVRVSATDAPAGAQAAYVAVQWDVASRFQWTSPTGSDHLPQDGIGQGYFRWKSTYDAATGQLAISLDQGKSWQTIDETVDLSAEHYGWQPPPVLASAQAQMVVNGTTYLSDTFTLSRTLPFSVGFNCGDSALLQWERVEGATGYTLYTLGERYLEATAVVTDTLAILRSANGESPWYSVAPRLNDAEGIRSFALNADSQGAGCFVSGFLAGINDDAQVSLLLDLGTTYQVEEVAFERWDGTAFRSLASVTDVKNLLQEYVDTDAPQGHNEYRARLRLANDEEVLTEPASVYYLTEQPALLFPNPVLSSEYLNVYTRSFGQTPARIILYNELGQEVLSQALNSQQEVIAVDGLLPGLYTYAISVGDERFRGKIIVQ